MRPVFEVNDLSRIIALDADEDQNIIELLSSEICISALRVHRTGYDKLPARKTGKDETEAKIKVARYITDLSSLVEECRRVFDPLTENAEDLRRAAAMLHDFIAVRALQHDRLYLQLTVTCADSLFDMAPSEKYHCRGQVPGYEARQYASVPVTWSDRETCYCGRLTNTVVAACLPVYADAIRKTKDRLQQQSVLELQQKPIGQLTFIELRQLEEHTATHPKMLTKLDPAGRHEADSADNDTAQPPAQEPTVVPDTSAIRSETDHPLPDASDSRTPERKRVEDYLEDASKEARQTITKEMFYKAKGYKDPTALQAYMRRDPDPKKNTPTARRNFDSLLSMPIEDFLNLLRKKRIIDSPAAPPGSSVR